MPGLSLILSITKDFRNIKLIINSKGRLLEAFRSS